MREFDDLNDGGFDVRISSTRGVGVRSYTTGYRDVRGDGYSSGLHSGFHSVRDHFDIPGLQHLLFFVGGLDNSLLQ